jgi:hypothetical protein
MDRSRGRQKGRTLRVRKAKVAEELTRIAQAALKLYRRYPNVLGVSTGTKYVKRRATDNHASVQFYVRKKGSLKTRRQRALPRFMYGRFKDGRVNRKLRFTTDVIEVGRIRAVCGAGSPIFSSIGLTRQNGAMSFIFRNKAESDSHYYVLSCAHVIGNIDEPGDLSVLVESEMRPETVPFATTLFSGAQAGGVVQYDIAIAQVNAACLPMRDLEIAGTNAAIRSFMPQNQITPTLRVKCMLPVSHAERGTVESYGGSVDIEYRKGTYAVQNAWMAKVNKRVRVGDSGGILYADGTAIGVVFAASGSEDGWAWFHPFVDAFEYVRSNVGIDLKCFQTLNPKMKGEMRCKS